MQVSNIETWETKMDAKRKKQGPIPGKMFKKRWFVDASNRQQEPICNGRYYMDLHSIKTMPRIKSSSSTQ